MCVLNKKSCCVGAVWPLLAGNASGKVGTLSVLLYLGVQAVAPSSHGGLEDRSSYGGLEDRMLVVRSRR